MQLRDFSSFFHPEEFDSLTAAYEAAWQDLWTQRLTLTRDQIPALKKNLAQIILASACSGKRDVEQLKEIALRGVSGQTVCRYSPNSPRLVVSVLERDA